MVEIKLKCFAYKFLSFIHERFATLGENFILTSAVKLLPMVRGCSSLAWVKMFFDVHLRIWTKNLLRAKLASMPREGHKTKRKWKLECVEPENMIIKNLRNTRDGDADFPKPS